MRFLFILGFCIIVFTATEVIAQREMPAFGDPTKLKKHQPDPAHLPPGYVPPEGGITDLQVMRQNKIEMAQRVEMSCSSKDIFISYRTTIQRNNKYHFNDPDNEYLFVMEGLIEAPRNGYTHNLVVENIKRDTVYLRLQIIPPGPEVKDSLKISVPLAFGGKLPLGKNPVTKAQVTLDDGSGKARVIKCSEKN